MSKVGMANSAEDDYRLEHCFSDRLLTITLCTATVSCVFALFFSVRSDLRKTGIGIRCDFAISGSIATKEQWIGKLELQNMKDRSERVAAVLGEGIGDQGRRPLDTEDR